MAFSHFVATPTKPNDAINMKARLTPPNWASTPEVAEVMRLKGACCEVEMAYAMNVPRTPGTMAVTNASLRLVSNPARYWPPERIE